MSIIHQALSKSQNKSTGSSPYYNIESDNLVFVKWLLALIFIILALIPVKFYWSSHKNSKPAFSAAATPPSAAKIAASLVLNGYYISGKYRLAEINHHFYEVGNVVNDMQIVSIEPNKVTLQKDGKNVELRFVL